VWEPEELQQKNVWRYPESYWTDEDYAFKKDKHSQMIEPLRDTLKNLMAQVY